ncbi:MAG: alpha/beta fold hydrolase [Bacteroidetes bacterium]|nr:alpha/beta fold hydrolase [Bacteroidota bacterium]
MVPQQTYLETHLEARSAHPSQTVHWHAAVYGSGPLILLAFHGFSQSASYFAPLAKPLEGIAQVWALELPGHHKTNWPGERPCTTHDLLNLIQAIKARTNQGPLAVLGFSMGGRYAFALGQTAGAELHSLHLAAPEGLSPNWAQIISTETGIGRWIIKRQIDHPGIITGPVKAMERMGILNKKMADFARANIANRTLRVQLRESWIAMSGLKPDHAQLAASASEHHFPVHLYAGKRDPLISLPHARKLANSIPGAALHEFEKGHFLIDEAFGQRLAGLLQPR